jgi:acyl-CoA synthetase (AMP-forming)/AMP-acid ligase II
VLCAGAPVPASLWADAPRFLPHGRLHSPYGATEALPVSSISSDEVDLASVRGACVGRPVPEIGVKIIAISDQPIATLAEARELPPGDIGEIIVSGPVVTKEYDALPAATALAKIKNPKSEIENSPAVWHRLGDCGYLDTAGLLWFCGRKAERVETAGGPMFTEPCEQVFRRHPRAVRCALIGLGPHGQQRPAIVIEANRAWPANSAPSRSSTNTRPGSISSIFTRVSRSMSATTPKSTASPSPGGP